MLGLNVAAKYASVVTKNLGLGFIFRLCSAGNFIITNQSFVLRTVIW